MPRFQVEISVSGSGYIELDAVDAETAAKEARNLPIEILFPINDTSIETDLNTDLFDCFADVRVDDVNEVEPE
jgi:hypothetical protein